jgi:hypothetical protein
MAMLNAFRWPNSKTGLTAPVPAPQKRCGTQGAAKASYGPPIFRMQCVVLLCYGPMMDLIEADAWASSGFSAFGFLGSRPENAFERRSVEAAHDCSLRGMNRWGETGCCHLRQYRFERCR